MKILMIADDYWHSSEMLMRGMAFLKDQGYEMDWISDAKDIVTYDLLLEYDEVIIAKGNSLTAGNQHPWFEEGTTLLPPDGYWKYVKEGGSLFILHAGASFRKEDCAEMTDLFGVSFIEHPKQCPVEVRIVRPDHPIAGGLENFTLSQDEHYFIERTEQEGDVVMESVSHAGTQPACIARTVGKGRVCVLTPGHNLLVFRNEGFRKALVSCIEWTAFKR
ncbi:MAG: ThuA domain-containing protein [Clostridia bacterium]|nr:ThuA domain-containing protein [Clostridia bacterium]